MTIPRTFPAALHRPDPNREVRQVEFSDLDPLLADCWRDRDAETANWLLGRVLKQYSVQRGAGMVALAPDRTIIGYGQLSRWPRCAEISDLYINAGYRRQGYGTAIIQHLIQQAMRWQIGCVEIGAAEANPEAVQLYRNLGFNDSRVVLMNLGNDAREPVIYMTLILPLG
ncbi:MAG: GNAT family N-acetyltransferase [Phototrophicaceae bacterium]|jgi:GNAT superfamily N-acetyltransferase